MTSPADATAPDDHADDTQDAQDAGGGQVSETSVMTPEGGAGSTPGTDDGVPPSEDSRTTPGTPPGAHED